jgi:hypothetical protein
MPSGYRPSARIGSSDGARRRHFSVTGIPSSASSSSRIVMRPENGLGSRDDRSQSNLLIVPRWSQAVQAAICMWPGRPVMGSSGAIPQSRNQSSVKYGQPSPSRQRPFVSTLSPWQTGHSISETSHPKKTLNVKEQHRSVF